MLCSKHSGIVTGFRSVYNLILVKLSLIRGFKKGINIQLTNDVVITARNRSCGGTLLGRAKPAASKICAMGQSPYSI